MELLNYFFNSGLDFIRPIKNLSPYRSYKVEDGYIIIADTLGIPKEDVQVTLDESAIITIKGKAQQVIPYTYGGKKHEKDIENNYEQNIRIGIDKNVYQNIEKINYTVKDGVTTVHLRVKSHKPKFSINLLS